MIAIAKKLRTDENNVSSWIFQIEANIDPDTIIQIDTPDGKYSYAPYFKFNTIDELLNNATMVMSQTALENNIYFYLNLDPNQKISAPLIKDIDGKLYQLTNQNGSQILCVEEYKSDSGEVVDRINENEVVVRLFYTEKYMENLQLSENNNYADIKLLYEDGRWKYNP